METNRQTSFSHHSLKSENKDVSASPARLGNKPRREIIQLNGLTILVVMALVANFLIVGFVYRWHQWKLFTLEKEHQIYYSKLLKKEHDIKDEIVKIEGVSTWNDTAYARAHKENAQ